MKYFFLIILLLMYATGFAKETLFKMQTCASCHGTQGQGNSRDPLTPVLAGQQPAYFISRMNFFRAQKNKQHSLDEQDIKNLADYFAAQKPAIGKSKTENLTRGRQLWMGGDLRYRIPACSSCHGPAGEGNNDGRIPRVAGQSEAYIIQQLKAYRNESRKHPVMSDIALQLSNDDIDDIANYLQGLY